MMFIITLNIIMPSKMDEYVVLEWLLSALMREEGVRNLLTKRTGKEGEQRGDL